MDLINLEYMQLSCISSHQMDSVLKTTAHCYQLKYFITVTTLRAYVINHISILN